MSDDDNFLARWSRRKRDVAESERAKSEVAPPAKPVPEAQASAPSPEPEFDLSKLPSLDSITASTDITAFMQAGVPTALRHAALRRAWSADPTIRDFIGPAENAWDFTDPNAMDGFGALDPGIDVAEMARKIVGGGAPQAEVAADQAVPAEPAELSAPEATTQTPAEADTSEDQARILHREEDAASQQDDVEAQEPVAVARKHGGAMPQ